MNHFHFPVSFGTILVSWNPLGLLSRLEWSESRLALCQRVKIPAEFSDLIDQIRGYFYQGEPMGEAFWSYLDQSEWSAFQGEVYRIIAKIPHGETRTYGWVAKCLGKPAGGRAVGQALKKNPLPILIPCHRVLASKSLGGFMGSLDSAQPEMRLKRRLLLLEEEYKSPVFNFLAPGGGWPSFKQADFS